LSLTRVASSHVTARGVDGAGLLNLVGIWRLVRRVLVSDALASGTEEALHRAEISLRSLRRIAVRVRRMHFTVMVSDVLKTSAVAVGVAVSVRRRLLTVLIHLILKSIVDRLPLRNRIQALWTRD